MGRPDGQTQGNQLKIPPEVEEGQYIRLPDREIKAPQWWYGDILVLIREKTG